MLRGAVSRSALIVGVLALLGGAVLGGRMLSGAPDHAGVDGEVLEVGPKLRPSAEEPEPDPDTWDDDDWDEEDQDD